MSLSQEQVQWVATLARLNLEPAELELMTRQLGSIVDYVAQLQRIPTDNVEPLAHPFPLHNIFRDDAPGQSLSVDAALANAPDRRGDFYGVPAVFD